MSEHICCGEASSLVRAKGTWPFKTRVAQMQTLGHFQTEMLPKHCRPRCNSDYCQQIFKAKDQELLALAIISAPLAAAAAAVCTTAACLFPQTHIHTQRVPTRPK